MEKVLPRGLNYSDIKPEAIENMVRVVRFTPTATVNNAKPNDIIRFMLTGNGFYDPYSAYIKMDVTVDMAKFKLTQTTAPTSEQNFVGQFLDRSAHSIISRLVVKSQGTELERIDQYDVMCAMINDMLYSQEQSVLHHLEGMPTESLNTNNSLLLPKLAKPIYNPAIVTRMITPTSMSGQWNYLGDQGFFSYRAVKAEEDDMLSYLNYHYKDFAPPNGAVSEYKTFEQGPLKTYSTTANGDLYQSSARQTWCIPIYSGILGVLQPDKKLLPLSLMPLEVEFTVNPYAFYSVGLDANDSDQRNFLIEKFWIYSHVLFFEQELHRSLESVVAENGIFIHFNSFYLAPIATHQGSSITQYAQINIHAKSINSVHFVFIYRGFEASNGPRKLHFVNHNLNTLQIRNGTELTPSDSIQGEQGSYKSSNQHAQFLIETFKAYNKLHDPTTDAAITGFNFATDALLEKPTNALDMLAQQARLGRCQYGVSLEGEEIGQDKTIISGRKGLMPFDINMGSLAKTHNTDSYQIIFIKADYIVYVRPDLVVTILGR